MRKPVWTLGGLFLLCSLVSFQALSQDIFSYLMGVVSDHTIKSLFPYDGDGLTGLSDVHPSNSSVSPPMVTFFLISDGLNVKGDFTESKLLRQKLDRSGSSASLPLIQHPNSDSESRAKETPAPSNEAGAESGAARRKTHFTSVVDRITSGDGGKRPPDHNDKKKNEPASALSFETDWKEFLDLLKSAFNCHIYEGVIAWLNEHPGFVENLSETDIQYIQNQLSKNRLDQAELQQFPPALRPETPPVQIKKGKVKKTKKQMADKTKVVNSETIEPEPVIEPVQVDDSHGTSDNVSESFTLIDEFWTVFYFALDNQAFDQLINWLSANSSQFENLPPEVLEQARRLLDNENLSQEILDQLPDELVPVEVESHQEIVEPLSLPEPLPPVLSSSTSDGLITVVVTGESGKTATRTLSSILKRPTTETSVKTKDQTTTRKPRRDTVTVITHTRRTSSKKTSSSTSSRVRTETTTSQNFPISTTPSSIAATVLSVSDYQAFTQDIEPTLQITPTPATSNVVVSSPTMGAVPPPDFQFLQGSESDSYESFSLTFMGSGFQPASTSSEQPLTSSVAQAIAVETDEVEAEEALSKSKRKRLKKQQKKKELDELFDLTVTYDNVDLSTATSQSPSSSPLLTISPSLKKEISGGLAPEFYLKNPGWPKANQIGVSSVACVRVVDLKGFS